jgi:D-2-hydroxyacid dehydrogenase (NADP+)
MIPSHLPSREELSVCFAHPAYRLGDAFAQRNTGLTHCQVRSLEDLKERASQAHVIVASGLWRNELLDIAANLRFVQSISSGTDQYDKERFRQKGIRLASAQGVNARAVAEHAMALILALARHLHTGRDNQSSRTWRGMIADPATREDELGGKTLLIVGLGRIGGRLASLAKVFDLRVIATKRDTSVGASVADAVHPMTELPRLLPHADLVVLTCPLTPETENLIDATALARMKPSAHLINVARGRLVDEAALIAALRSGQIAAAGLDCTREEPLPADSPLWAMPNVLLTPHTAGETRRYEDGVIDLLLDNLERLWRGETVLRNEIV